jgi:intracellular septation protein
MKLLFDFLPIVAFFIAYKFFGIYIATAVAIAISLLQVIGYWIKYRQLSSLQLISLGTIVVFGGATLLLHDEIIIKWKPSVLYWILSLVFLGSQYLGKKTFVQHLMESNITLSKTEWVNINMSWVIFFALMGFINLYVAYHFSTDTWVNFKLFGLLGLTTIFILGQAIYLAAHIKQIEKS